MRLSRHCSFSERGPASPALADRYLNNPHSIDVRAVAMLGDALYKDIRLSGNRVRVWPERVREAGI